MSAPAPGPPARQRETNAAPQRETNAAPQRESNPAPKPKKRIGVVLTELGLTSEVWAMRQIEGFEAVEPVLFGWSLREGWSPPAGLETHLFDGPFARAVTPRLRLGWRLGLTASVLSPPGGREAMRRALLAADLDGVLAHFAWNAMRVVPAVGDRLPVVCQVHGRDVSKFLENRAYRRALRRTLPRLAHVAAVGSAQIERLRPYGLGAHSLIPCGAPFDAFAAAPIPQRAAGEPLRLVSVGRLSAEKGVMQTLEAFRRLGAAGIEAEWSLAGDGELAGALDAALAADPPPGAVHRLGPLDGAQVARLLAGCHVFVQHSRTVAGWNEGFGVSIAEGGAAGLPLVASASGGILDQVRDGENGLLHAEDDVAAQAEAMIRLARDEPLRRRMGARAREVARGFDAAALTARLEARLLDAVGARAA